MAQKEKKVKKSRRSRRTVAVFWISLILVVTPIAILGWILFSSAMDTGTPIFGNRYEGDLDPAITDTEITTIDERVIALDGVEAEFSNMASATLRIYAQIPVESTNDVALEKASEIYTVVSEVLDPSVYFTQADGKKMYDLEIHVYNMDGEQDRTADNFVYVISTKTSNMSEPASQVVSDPVSADLAARLRQDVEDRKAAEAAAAEAAAAEAAAASAEPESTEGTEEASETTESEGE